MASSKNTIFNIDKLLAGITSDTVVLDAPKEKLIQKSLESFITADELVSGNVNLDVLKATVDAELGEGNALSAHLSSAYKAGALVPLSELQADSEIQNAFFDLNYREMAQYTKNKAKMLFVLDTNPADMEVTFSKDALGYQSHTLMSYDEIMSEKKEITDKGRIRDMFYIAKLNAKSLYASKTYYPEITVEEADSILESSGVVSNLALDTHFKDNVLGTAKVGDQMFFLSCENNRLENVIKSTIFRDESLSSWIDLESLTENIIFDTYFKNRSMISLYQAFENNNSETHYTPQNFKNWYERHNRNIVVTKIGSDINPTTEIDILGAGSYKVKTSPVALVHFNNHVVKYRTGASDNAYNELLDATEYAVSSGGAEGIGSKTLAVYGGIVDSSYIDRKTRTAKIMVPYNKDCKETYLFFRFEFNISANILSIASKEDKFSLSFSLDGKDSITFYSDRMESGEDPDGLEKGNPLYDTFKDWKAVKASNGLFKITIPTDNINKTDHFVLVGFTGTYPVSSGILNTSYYRTICEETYITLSDLSLQTNVSSDTSMTYGSYIAESDISDEEKATRMREFWEISRYVDLFPYQFVSEMCLTNKTTYNKYTYNNFNTSDIYTDILTTKSQLDAEYKMTNEEGHPQNFLSHRIYSNITNCSDSLVFHYQDNYRSTAENSGGKLGGIVPVYNTRGDYRGSNKVSDFYDIRFQKVEVVKNINRFDITSKHKANIFSVVVGNSGFEENLKNRQFYSDLSASKTEIEEQTFLVDETTLEEEKTEMEKAKEAYENQLKIAASINEIKETEKLRYEETKKDIDSFRIQITNRIREVVNALAPVNTQLVKVYFEN